MNRVIEIRENGYWRELDAAPGTPALMPDETRQVSLLADGRWFVEDRPGLWPPERPRGLMYSPH